MSQKKFADKVAAVVTGGTRGIGLAIAESLARAGADLAVTYVSDEKAALEAEAVLKAAFIHPEQKVMLLKGDVSDPDTVTAQYTKAREALGPILVLVNNAGIMPVRNFAAIEDETWRRTIDINLSGAFYWMSRVFNDMKAAGRGRIVNMASIAGRGGGVIGPHYAASKAGMFGLTRYAARELGPFGITVNCVNPAFIMGAGPFVQISDEREKELAAKVVVPKLGECADVVNAFEYLMETPFVTGTGLDVNGGAFMI